MLTLQRVAHPDEIDWPALYPLALAAGCGYAVKPADERVAAADELLALTIPQLVGLTDLAALAPLVPIPDELVPFLARHSAAVVRLLDRALTARGRDHGYDVTAWRGHANDAAWVAAHRLGRLEAEERPVHAAIEHTALFVVSALTALPRDRLAVPEALADAIGPLLIIYAATADTLPTIRTRTRMRSRPECR